MKDCFKRFLLSSLSLLVFAGAFFGSCTDVDNRLGLGLLPDDQELIFKETVLDGVRSYMAMPDSIPVNQRNLMVLGNYTTDGYGYLRSGAVIQFTPMSFSTGTEFWGYMPEVDTVKLVLSVAQVYGDTTKEQKFYMYRLTENIRVDSVYYPGFPGEKYADMVNPVFSFTLKSEGTGTIVKTLDFESGAKKFFKDLVNVSADVYNDNVYVDSLFRDVMHGFYIAPSKDPAEAPLDAAMYMISTLSSPDEYNRRGDDTYLYFYGHNIYESPDEDEKTDPIIVDGTTHYIKDTVEVVYSFDDTYLAYRNANIMTLERSYDSYPNPPSNLVNLADTVDKYNFISGTVESQSPFYVQGLLGVAGYLDFGQEFLRQLDDICTVDGERRIMKVNRALLHVWLEEEGVPYLNNAPARLGMYYDYKGYLPTNIPDYDYVYESQGSNYTIAYGGYLNRGMGYYEMDISLYVQKLANQTDETPKQVWLAPGASATQLYAPTQVALLNPPDSSSGEPDHKRISLKLTYTLLKNTID